MMNSVLIKENNVLEYGQIPIPEPGKDQVLVKMHSIPINPSDLLFMKGLLQTPLVHPFTPGWEGSGEVVKAGPGD